MGGAYSAPFGRFPARCIGYCNPPQSSSSSEPCTCSKLRAVCTSINGGSDAGLAFNCTGDRNNLCGGLYVTQARCERYGGSFSGGQYGSCYDFTCQGGSGDDSSDPPSDPPSHHSSASCEIGGEWNDEYSCYFGDDVSEDCCNRNGGHFYDSSSSLFGTRACCDDVLPSSASSESSGCPEGDDLKCQAMIALMSFVSQAEGYGAITGDYNTDTCHCDIDCDDKDAIQFACLAIGGTYDASVDSCGCKDPCDLETASGCIADGCTIDPLLCDCDCDSDSDSVPSTDPCDGEDCGCGKAVPDGKGGCSCDCGDCYQPACRDELNKCKLDCTLCTHEDGSCGPCGEWKLNAQEDGCACTCSGTCDDGAKCVSASSGGVCECKSCTKSCGCGVCVMDGDRMDCDCYAPEATCTNRLNEKSKPELYKIDKNANGVCMVVKKGRSEIAKWEDASDPYYYDGWTGDDPYTPVAVA